LGEPFSEENHQLNSMLKMVRTKVVERHATRIQFLYTPEARDIQNNHNREAIKEILT
jgi:long-chain acyl-CoA synthetase